MTVRRFVFLVDLGTGTKFTASSANSANVPRPKSVQKKRWYPDSPDHVMHSTALLQVH